jgi:hypothetical protein
MWDEEGTVAMHDLLELSTPPPAPAEIARVAEELRAQARRFATLARNVSEDELAERFRRVATDLFVRALELERTRRNGAAG